MTNKEIAERIEKDAAELIVHGNDTVRMRVVLKNAKEFREECDRLTSEIAELEDEDDDVEEDFFLDKE